MFKFLKPKVFPFGLLLVLNVCLKTNCKTVLPTITSINPIPHIYKETQNPPQCPSKIYCYGDLLKTVQMAQIFTDSKTFVDMSLKNTPEETLENFDQLMAATNDNPSQDAITTFVYSNFNKRGSEFKEWTPNDWKETPRFLDLIRNADLRQWGSDLHGLWKVLGRQMVDDVGKNPDHYSIIHVDHPVIVPGGRFLEFYYWDSYWIIRGLLYSEMYHTAQGMLLNFLSIIERFGFIPNGGRIYYSGRSQPPLLTGMVKSYVDFTKNYEFAINNVKTLEHEFEFWMNNHAVEVNGHQLYHYGDSTSGPRPESYREDIETAERFETEEEKEACYSELKAAAESGMDFSSRWFIDEDKSNQGGLSNLKCRSIIPVELNAILYWNAKLIAEFYSLAKNVEKANQFEKQAQRIYEAVEAVLWNEEDGVWYDYDVLNNIQRKFFSPTNISPLWTKCYNISNSETISKTVVKYLNETNHLDDYPGGVPNTLEKSGEQWDFPNVWPPMQYIIVKSLENLNTDESKDLAERWATRWTKSNFKAYTETQAMFEKYNAEKFGGHGGGGEYEIQKGFGWTNGVIIEFLVQYGDKLANNRGFSLSFNPAITITLALVTCLIAFKFF